MNDEQKQLTKRAWLEKLMILLGREPQNQEQLMEILRTAESKNILSGEMLGMIERILQVAEMQVREVMLPKTQMVIITEDQDLESILDVVIDSGHSRFPVYDVGENNIIGMMLAKDLIAYGFDQIEKPFLLKDILRPVIFTPQSKRLDILLREFRNNRNHIAIVLDEYSHVAGLVTIEDVLEQIVGDIEDEYDIEDEEETFVKKLDEHTFIVKATMEIAEFNDYFHVNFSDEEFDTIGGIVLKEFGQLPKRGAVIKLQHLRFKVLHSDNRRLYLIEVKTSKRKE